MRYFALGAIISLILAMPARANWETGLVAHYTFDEGSGSTVQDQSGNGNNGTIYGATYVPHGYAPEMHLLYAY